MVCFLKLGKTHHLQTLRLEGHLEIMIQVFQWFLWFIPLNFDPVNIIVLSFISLNLVDVVEIGERQGKTGNILKVKPLAALAMIDEGELDWKIVAISLNDPRASLLNDVDDVEKHFPVIFLSCDASADFSAYSICYILLENVVSIKSW